MASVLFLDIDGVLNSQRFRAENTPGDGASSLDETFDTTAHIDPARVAKLNRLLRETSARVVLSSSWRLVFGLEKTLRSLRARGFEHPLSDVTLRVSGGDRHDEIRLWLAGHASPPDFVILDDEITAGTGFDDRFIHVPDGLEDHHVARAVALLKRP